MSFNFLPPKTGQIKNRSEYMLQRGKALNVMPEYSTEALECLSKAVKLDPKLVEAWNQLGECYWKNKDIETARNCFTGALNHVRLSIHVPVKLFYVNYLYVTRSIVMRNVPQCTFPRN